MFRWKRVSLESPSAAAPWCNSTEPEHEAQLRRMPVNYVIDHCGKFRSPVGPDDEPFRCLLRLVETGKCWVKIAAYEFSKDAPRFEDVGRLMRILVRETPERVIWATNWPHAAAAKVGYPDDAALLDLLLDWAPDESARRKLSWPTMLRSSTDFRSSRHHRGQSHLHSRDHRQYGPSHRHRNREDNLPAGGQATPMTYEAGIGADKV